MNEEAELLPCPFCGGGAEAEWVDFGDRVQIGCNNPDCKARTGPFLSRAYAQTAWNRRADGWIPVGERLPDKSVLVQVWRETGIYTISPVLIAYRFRDDWVTSDGLYDLDSIYRITHWRPMPPPPAD